jgi:hypothetical protein
LRTSVVIGSTSPSHTDARIKELGVTVVPFGEPEWQLRQKDLARQVPQRQRHIL